MSIEKLQAIRTSQVTVYMTPEEGQDLAAKGFISVLANEIDPNRPGAYRVMLTAAGLAQCETQPAQPKVKPTFEIETGVVLPAIKRGGGGGARNRESSYPFDKMEVGHSFHVAVTEQDKEPWSKLSSSVNAANKRSEVEVVPQVIETTQVKKIIKDTAGNNVLDAFGKKTYSIVAVTGPKMIATKKFRACKVGQTDPKGPGCRVFRIV